MLEHDQRFENIDRKFDQVDEHFEYVDKQFGNIDSKFISQDSVNKELLLRLFDNQDKLDQFVTKSEFFEFKDDMITTQDFIIRTLTRIEQELLVYMKRTEKLEKTVYKSNYSSKP